MISFDSATDLTDPNTFIATEVFHDHAARQRQESLPQVAAVMALLPKTLAARPELTVYNTTPTNDDAAI